MDFRAIVPQLLALHNEGTLPIPGLPLKVNTVAEPGDVNVSILTKILKFYEANKGLFTILLPIIQGLLKGSPGKAPAVPVVTPPAPPPPPTVIAPPPLPGGIVAPPVKREIASLNVSYFWINRKNTPWVEGGGRYLLPSDKVKAILSREDPLQAGDRVCFDVTPRDQFGRVFAPGDDANVLMKGIEYEVVGGIGELQLQDPEGLGFDPTPVVFVPWEASSGVKPGFQAELGLIARYTSPNTGVEVVGQVSTVRIRPWGV